MYVLASHPLTLTLTLTHSLTHSLTLTLTHKHTNTLILTLSLTPTLTLTLTHTYTLFSLAGGRGRSVARRSLRGRRLLRMHTPIVCVPSVHTRRRRCVRGGGGLGGSAAAVCGETYNIVRWQHDICFGVFICCVFWNFYA